MGRTPEMCTLIQRHLDAVIKKNGDAKVAAEAARAAIHAATAATAAADRAATVARRAADAATLTALEPSIVAMQLGHTCSTCSTCSTCNIATSLENFSKSQQKKVLRGEHANCIHCTSNIRVIEARNTRAKQARSVTDTIRIRSAMSTTTVQQAVRQQISSTKVYDVSCVRTDPSTITIAGYPKQVERFMRGFDATLSELFETQQFEHTIILSILANKAPEKTSTEVPKNFQDFARSLGASCEAARHAWYVKIGRTMRKQTISTALQRRVGLPTNISKDMTPADHKKLHDALFASQLKASPRITFTVPVILAPCEIKPLHRFINALGCTYVSFR
jgi:hypothetical protein